jgi:hypothetical protein
VNFGPVRLVGGLLQALMRAQMNTVTAMLLHGFGILMDS